MTHSPAPAFAHSSGPRSAQIAIVGEAWGDKDELIGLPFMGASGTELDQMLREAGLRRSDCFVTNTLAFRPPNNDVLELCDSKKAMPPGYALPPLKAPGKFLRPEYLGEINRLGEELDTVAPNLILALGNIACWALLGSAGIASLRGTVAQSKFKAKALPTYHPAAILRNWSLRSIVVADFMKAAREATFPEIIRPERTVLIDPSRADLTEFLQRAASCSLMGVDIETAAGMITCIGFAISREYALVIPFSDPRQTTGSYWPSDAEELEAWACVQHLLALPCPKVFQNGLYDLQYILRMGFTPRNVLHDTMLLHHSLFPELQKGLGFLGSIYTNEASWKLLRKHTSNEAVKKDE